MTRLTAVLALAFAVLPALAQSPLKDLAPLQFGQDAWFVTDTRVGGFVVTAQRAVPVSELLPNVSRNSRMKLLSVSGGFRALGQNRDADVAFSITALDMLIEKTPWAGGLTLLSYDRTGPIHTEATWVGVTAGPSARLGSRVRVRAMGSASLGTVSAGGSYFLAPADASTGFDGGVSGAATLRVTDGAAMNFAASRTKLFAGHEPVRTEWDLRIVARMTRTIGVTAGVAHLDASSNRFSESTGLMARASVRVTPRSNSF